LDFNDPKLLGDPEHYTRLAEHHRRIADALDGVARAIRGDNGKLVSGERIIHRIVAMLRERGPMTEEQLLEATVEDAADRENPAREVKKSISAGLRWGTLVSVEGKILLPDD
jgi:hypothetical protein